MTAPTVSVIIPTFNRAALLPRAIASVIAQTFVDWEIVLVDDGSTDETATLAADYADHLGDRFQYIRQAHTGCCAARNRGIEAARGRFIAFLDSDDEFAPSKLARQLELFALRPELGFVYSDYACIDLQGAYFESVFDSKCPMGRRAPCASVGRGLYVCRSSLADALLRDYFIATIVGLVRREVLDDSLRFMPDPAYAEEWVFYLQVARSCVCGFVDEPLSIHHFTRESVSRTYAHRNHAGLYRALLDIRRCFDPMSREQRRLIHGHLARVCRQLGFDAYADGAFYEAVRRFRESLHFAKDFRTLLNITDALWQRLTSRGSEKLPGMFSESEART